MRYPEITLIDGILTGSTIQVGTPTPSIPIPLSDTIKGGIYEYVEDGNRYEVVLPTMRSVGSIADTWNELTGEFTQRIGNKVIDGTEPWTVGTNTTTMRFDSSALLTNGLSGSQGYINRLCSHFRVYVPTNEDIEHHRGTQNAGLGNYAIFWINKTRLSSLDVNGFKSWLATQYSSGNPVILYYTLATPVVTTINPTLVYESPIYDRTVEDVIYAKNNQSSVLDLKGSMNASDLNRIEDNTKYLSDVLNQCGYTNTVTVKTNWLESEFSTVAEIDRIKSNIIELVTVFSNYITNPTLELQSIYMSYSNLNDIEQILFNTNLILELMIDGFRYSGTFYHCGTDFEL